MNIKIKKWQMIAIGAVLLLVLLNPGIDRFEDFTGMSAGSVRGYGHYYSSPIKRTGNYLLFSIYQDRDYRYLGIAMNFIKIQEL